MFLGSTKKAHKKLLDDMKDSASKNRLLIDKKFKEAKVVEQQLADALSATKKLTSDISEKISTRLKITPKTLKTIVGNINEGVVVLDNNGIVLECNSSFSKMFLSDGDSIIGLNFKEVCNRLKPVEENGSQFQLTEDFSKLSQQLFNSASVKTQIRSDVILNVHPKDVSPFKCIFSMSMLDNSPDEVIDVSYILFFKCLKRSKDRERRVNSRIV